MLNQDKLEYHHLGNHKLIVIHELLILLILIIQHHLLDLLYLRNTTISGTPTCFDNKICSRVCGIGPSAAETTKIAPSI
jgi:hypothetical protein